MVEMVAMDEVVMLSFAKYSTNKTFFINLKLSHMCRVIVSNAQLGVLTEDVIGLLTTKGDIIEFSRNKNKSINIVVELDDREGHGKIRWILWEELATRLVKHIEKQEISEYIIIMKFAKFNMFKGTMGISNTNYNSILYINPNF
ncbi:hypothetical protein Ahy_A05g025617 [Arachis hypogaea]|uniref:DUF223 domain-containing protein n=1 Tax=Arachis hypogaea TaxID=3818 RepID=A0A445D952_ARAHY|nr:hypothetical protein Ahy_A05g025617 [Arachis hypogaea]